MKGRAAVVTLGDTVLLRAIERSQSVVAAARSVRMSRDRATYRLARLAAAFGGAVVAARRGGERHGTSRLTPLGASIAHGSVASVEMRRGRAAFPGREENLFVGTYRAGPPPTVTLPGGPRLTVAFEAEDGASVGVRLEPDAVLIAPARFPSSARNVLRGTVSGAERAVAGAAGTVCLRLRVGQTVVRAVVTAATVAELGLRRGAAAYLFVKATALTPVGVRPSSPPSRARPRSRARRPPPPRGGSVSR